MVFSQAIKVTSSELAGLDNKFDPVV